MTSGRSSSATRKSAHSAPAPDFSAFPAISLRPRASFAQRSSAGLKRNLYDSYVRAFRWATDRIGGTGVVAFVSNGGWIESNSGDGIRRALADEYSRIYVYNLRGNQRTAGEISRKEGGKIFGSGSRNTVAILIGVKNPTHTGPCEIFYRDIGDYLTREQKLEIVAGGDLTTVDWQTIIPNTHGDWTNQRNDEYSVWPAIGSSDASSKEAAVFATYSLGISTARDAWVYGFSRKRVVSDVKKLIENYNRALDNFDAFCASTGIETRRTVRNVSALRMGRDVTLHEKQTEVPDDATSYRHRTDHFVFFRCCVRCRSRPRAGQRDRGR